MDKKIAEVNKLLTDQKQIRAKMEARLLKKFDKADIDGCRGTRAVSSVRRTDFPSIKNRKAFLRYVVRNKAYDLLQNRIAARAYNDRLEEGEVVPGVSVFTRISVSIRKRGSK